MTHRRAPILSALACVLVGAAAAVLSASAPALASTTNQIGGGGGTSAQTNCPSGTWAVGFEITRNNTPNFYDSNAVTNYTRGVQLDCSDGSSSAYVGGALPAPQGHTTATAPSSCASGDAVVGVYGRSGAIVDGFGAECATTATSNPYAASYVGRPVNNPEGVGGPSGPYDCAGTRITGVQITYTSYLNEDTISSVIGVCGTNAITLTTPSSGTYAGSGTLTVSTTEGAFAPASIVSDSTSICTVSGLTVTYISTGTCELSASAPGATSVVNNITVNQADTTTTLSSSSTNTSVNQPVTFTATVAPIAPATATPTGTVSFYIDGAAAAAATTGLANGVATYTTSFGGGSHSVVAVYNGDMLYNSSTSTPATPVTVGCTQIISGTHAGLTVTAGTTTCLVNATITGGITVARGGTLDIENSTVNGSITASHPAGVRICGSTTGSITVSAASGYVRIGDPANNCTPNTINGGLTAANNTGGGTISGNTITGSWSIAGNTPAFTVAGNHH